MIRTLTAILVTAACERSTRPLSFQQLCRAAHRRDGPQQAIPKEWSGCGPLLRVGINSATRNPNSCVEQPRRRRKRTALQPVVNRREAPSFRSGAGLRTGGGVSIRPNREATGASPTNGMG